MTARIGTMVTDWFANAWRSFGVRYQRPRFGSTGVLALVASAAVTLTVGSNAANAEADAWLDASALRAAFSGQTIDGIYPNRLTFTEHYGIDGRLVYTAGGAPAWTGDWSVEGVYFCTIYDTAPGGGCFKVRREGANCFLFHFATPDPADLARQPEADDVAAAAGWRADAPSTCPEQPVV